MFQHKSKNLPTFSLQGLLDPSEIPNIYKEPIAKQMMTSTKRFIRTLAAAVTTWPEFESLGAKIEANSDKIFDNFFANFACPDTTGYRVLIHGDFHIRNMMFRKDEEGSLVDCVFLDFQGPNYQSPALDVYSMLNAIGNRESRSRRWDVIKMYYTVFADSLRLFGFKGVIPSLIDLHVELMRMSRFGKRVGQSYQLRFNSVNIQLQTPSRHCAWWESVKLT